MIRVLGFFVTIAALAFGAAWLIERPGSLQLVWQGWEIETSVPVALLAVVLLAIGLLLIFWFVRTLVGVPDAISDFMRGRRRKRGMVAVAHGLMAVGTGDGRSARRSAQEARRLIGDEPLTLLLRAQAAQLSGDRDEAEQAFRAMLDQPETRPLGYRGLYVEARRRGDADEAKSLAERAVAASPNVPWAGPALLELQGASRDWDGALVSIERNVANKLIDKATGRRQRAVVLTAKALEVSDRNEPDGARELAREAAKLAPTFVPAATLAGRLLAEHGDHRRAAKVLDAAWQADPHPDIAEVYVHLRTGDAAADRIKRAAILAKRAPGHIESALALARAALEARDFAQARAALATHLEQPTRRICLLMAEIENAQSGDLGRARAWLARALTARRDPEWIADGVVSETWEPISPVSGRLDAFEWKTPQDSLAGGSNPLLDLEIATAEERADVEEIVVPEVPVADAVNPAPPAPSEVETAAPSPAPMVVSKPVPPSEVLLPLARAPDDPGPDDDDEASDARLKPPF